MFNILKFSRFQISIWDGAGETHKFFGVVLHGNDERANLGDSRANSF
jgi:hypothetical protein